MGYNILHNDDKDNVIIIYVNDNYLVSLAVSQPIDAIIQTAGLLDRLSELRIFVLPWHGRLTARQAALPHDHRVLRDGAGAFETLGRGQALRANR